ncbi:MAG: hypothetical protein K2N26_03080 [Oscillospiraceae bacterium]|nr:hypothetical protein [Oscillospiraceae bacterium]
MVGNGFKQYPKDKIKNEISSWDEKDMYGDMMMYIGKGPSGLYETSGRFLRKILLRKGSGKIFP